MSFPTRDEREVLRLRNLGASLLDRLKYVTNERDAALLAYAALDPAASEPFTLCEKIFEHKHLDPVCVESGCQSLLLAEALAAQTAMRLALRQAAEALAPFAWRPQVSDPSSRRVVDWFDVSDFRRAKEAHGAITAILRGIADRQ